MLVCPHCQFENPDTNKFCQRCGGTLTEVEAEPYSLAENPSRPVWQAILSLSNYYPDSASQNASPSQNAPNPLVLVENASPEIDLPPLPVLSLLDGKYLDAQQRYQVLDPLPDRIQGDTEIETKVLDCQPLKPSLLQTCYFPEFETSKLENATPFDGSFQSAVVPVEAQPYLDLQECCPFLPLPELHDAWEQDGVSVILLQDRTDLPLLVDICQNENIPPLQVLHWLHEMVEHWVALEPQRQCQSLLKLDNLRVDKEDHVLCLRRLYPDQPDSLPSLSNLGRVWQTLFEQSQRTQHGELFLLCRDLETGVVTSVEELRSRIESIAMALQSNEPSPSAALNIDRTMPTNPVPSLDAATAGEPEGQSNDRSVGAEEDLVSEADDQPTVVLPMRLISIEDAGRTITGRQRNHNEDCFYIQTEVKKIETKKFDDSQERTVYAKGLYLLCDGMGGHDGGEVASALAVETLRKYFEANWHDKLPNEQSIREAVYLANQAIYDENQQNSRLGSGRMGTTLVLVLLHGTEVAIAHVGDSRLYRFSRRQGLEQMTVDHEVGQREIQRGVEPAIAYARPDAYQLTQALGPRDEGFIKPDVKFFELNEDSILLLCSDGVTDNDLLELHWQSYLEPMLNVQSELEQSLNRLIEFANQFNGHDNITAIAIRARVRPNITQLKPR